MNKKISDLPIYIGVNNPFGYIPITINGVTYKIDPDKFFSNFIANELALKLDKDGYSGTAKDLQTLIVNATTGVTGNSIIPTSTPTGSGVASWVALQAGTYTNFGGVVVNSNSIAVISRNASNVYSVTQTLLVLNLKTETWTAKVYAVGDQVNYLGTNWVANAITLVTDIPNASTKWVDMLSEKINAQTYRASVSITGVQEGTLGYYSKTTGLFTASTAYRSIKFPVTFGTKYYATAVGRGTSTSLAVYYNSAGLLLGSQSQYPNGVDTTYTNELLILPANTAFVGLSTLVANDYGKLISKTGDVDLAVKAGYNGNLIDLDNALTFTKKELYGFDIRTGTPEASQGYYSKNTGVFSLISNYFSAKYTIDTTKTYTVDAIVFGTSAAMAVYFDASGNWVANQNIGTASQVVYKNTKLVFPSNTASVGLSGFSLQPILRQQNTTYNVALKGTYNGNLDDINLLKADKFDVGLIQSYACAGDSISKGSGSLDGNTSWCDNLNTRLGTTTFLKVAVAGHSIWSNLKTQLDSITTSVNLLTIMIGVNDVTLIIASTAIMGNVNEVLAINNDFPTNSASSTLFNHSILGRFRWCIENFRLRFPNTNILILSPIATTRSGFEPYLETMRDGQEKIAHFCSIKFERMTKNSLYTATSDWTSTVFYDDTTHPNPLGYKVLAGFVYDKLKK